MVTGKMLKAISKMQNFIIRQVKINMEWKMWKLNDNCQKTA